MCALIMDIETNGLLDVVDRIHSVVVKDTATKGVGSYFDDGFKTDIPVGLSRIYKAETLVGHNIISYDLLAIDKITKGFTVQGKIIDTLIAARLVYPNLAALDRFNPKVPQELKGKYSLEAFGYRLGIYKGDYGKKENCWEKWTPEMQKYCEQDVEVTEALYNDLLRKGIPMRALEIEQRFQYIIDKQTAHGVLVDMEALKKTVVVLEPKKAELEAKLQKVFKPKIKLETFIPKKPNKTLGYTGHYEEFLEEVLVYKDTGKEIDDGHTIYNCYDIYQALAWSRYSNIEYREIPKKKFVGDPFIKKTVVPFNPNSDDHIRERLLELGWIATHFTPTGKPKVSEDDIKDFNHPSVKVLTEYKKVTNALDKVATGDTSWLNCVQLDGRVHGTVFPFGTGTRRCSHSKPNCTQLPKNDYLEYICPRMMVIPTPGYVLVGFDASGLELRCLAHYMCDPEYTKTILEGKNEDGTDIHSVNMRAAGLPERDMAKTFIYGIIYGAGNAKVGAIINKGTDEGAKIKERFFNKTPALRNLMNAVKDVLRERDYLISIDGAQVPIDPQRQYIGLNYLLQGCGAIIMKVVLIKLYDKLTALGLTFGKEYAFVLNVHDEVQAEVLPEFVEQYKKFAIESIRETTYELNLNCMLDGEVKVGSNWSQTH